MNRLLLAVLVDLLSLVASAEDVAPGKSVAGKTR